MPGVKRAVPIPVTEALVLFGLSCNSPSPIAHALVTAPAATTTAAGLAGTWTGTGMDSQGATCVTWALTQSGTSVVGTVKTQAIDPTDGVCGSCHRNKSGTFTGTISGDRVSLTMFFAAGADGDPTPACVATRTGSAPTVVADRLSTAYSGSDSCEGVFENGTVSMTRRPVNGN